MKNIFKSMILAAVAVAAIVTAISCVRELDSPKPVLGDQTAIRITPVCAGVGTKATTPGDDYYHENTITDYYWFIFNSNADSSKPLVLGYVSGNSSEEILLDDYFPEGGTGYVYVVANLPVKPASPVEGDEWYEFVASTKTIKHWVQGQSAATNDLTYSVTSTLANLKTMSFGKRMPTTYPNSSEFYKYTSATTGLPNPQKFVMRTKDPVSFSLQQKQVVNVTAGLERVAAKIILDIRVTKEVEQYETTTEGIERYKMTWLSDMSQIQVYMLWGSTHGDLNGTKNSYSEEHKDWFYSASPRYAMYQNPAGGSVNAAGVVSGSVPADSCSTVTLNVESTVWEVVYQVHVDANGNPIWIWNSNVPASDRIEANVGNKEYGDWDYILVDGHKQPVVNADGSVQRQMTTQSVPTPFWSVRSLPMYSMPISWNASDPHAPFIKIILPWKGYNKNTQQPSDATPREYFYKILLPKQTYLDANYCYHVTVDLSVLGSEADEVPVAISGEYYVVDWNTPQAMGGDQSAGRYLNCATSFEFFSQDEINIPISSSHDIEIVGTPTAAYNNYSNSTTQTGYLTYSTSSSTGNNFTVTATSNSKVTVKHALETNLDDMESRDVSPITYNFTIQHKGAGGSAYQKTITVVQYPSIYIEASPNTGYDDRRSQNGNANSNGSYRSGYTFVNHTSYYFYGVWHGTYGLNGTSNSNRNMYVVTTKVLSKPGQVIGDPRMKANEIITNFTGTPSADGWVPAPALSGSSPRKLSAGYLQADPDDRTLNMIAPVIRIASSFGATDPYDYNTATRRCASYQEDGRPAGRWRLPTAAEIEFLVNLSAQHLLPRLFGSASGSTSYWSANGYCTVSNANNSVDPHPGVFTGTYYTRCVYDEWYWGSGTLSDRTVFTWGDEYSAN